MPRIHIVWYTLIPWFDVNTFLGAHAHNSLLDGDVRADISQQQ